MLSSTAADPGASRLRFEARPVLVFWEVTKACALSCQHCRATALPHALPGQLSTYEGRMLLDQVAAFGHPAPILVLTGGDCLERPDLLELAAHARELGLVVALSPSVTPALTPAALRPFAELGIKAISISLDGGAAPSHDGVRGVRGHFEATVKTLRWLSEAGFKVQVNTTVMRQNVEELPDIAALLVDLQIPIWEVFFLVNVGRGTSLSALNAAQNEDVCHFLFEASRYGFLVRTVEAPFFRRVAAWRRAFGDAEEPDRHFRLGPLHSRLSHGLVERLGPPDRRPQAQSVATRDGMGVIFVGHDGSVRPSGFLPVALGNVRDQLLGDIYRENSLLRAIRAAEFTGRCGVCSFGNLCGGSRARAYTESGDPLGEDSGCSFGAS